MKLFVIPSFKTSAAKSLVFGLKQLLDDPLFHDPTGLKVLMTFNYYARKTKSAETKGCLA